MILHVVEEIDWKVQESSLVYTPPSYGDEGFIHCCSKNQLAGVLLRYYKDKTGLILLYLDESKLEHPVIYEVATNNELFPHVYGGINKTAIVSIEKIR